MNKNSETTEARLALISRIIFFIAIVFLIGSLVSMMTHKTLWLTGRLATMGAILFMVDLIAPGILIIFRRPTFAYAWLRGRNPIVYANIHWDELSSDKRRSVYINSAVWFIFVIAFIVWVVSELY